jgi:transcriptional regulator with XRE-family HTH domain
MAKEREELIRHLQDPEARQDYVPDHLNAAIALQIKALRQQRKWTQSDLARRAGMKQSRISAMESVDYSGWSTRTLLRLAEAFDLPLVIRFESWSKFVDDVLSLSRAHLERPAFDQDAGMVTPSVLVNATESDTGRVLFYRGRQGQREIAFKATPVSAHG